MKQLLLSLLLLACTSTTAVPQTVQDPAFAEKLSGLLSLFVPVVDIDHVTPTGTIFLDAREPDEFEVSHIPGALPVGYKKFDIRLLQQIPKDTTVVVYCSVGYRSEKITEKLLDAGFTNVHNLYGGIFEWVNSGLSVVDQNGMTQRVHTYNKSWSKWLKKGVSVY